MKSLKETIPLNCVDKALFALDCEEEPMVLHWVLNTTGTVDPMRLRSALTKALMGWPVLRSTVRRGLFAKSREVRDLHSHDTLTVRDLTGADGGGSDPGQAEVSDWLNRRFDPIKHLACRVLLVRRGAEEWSLVFSFHHSAVDGVGGLRFVTEVIRRYNGAADEAPHSDADPGSEGDELLALARACRAYTGHFFLRMAGSLCHRFAMAPFSPNARMCRVSSEPSPTIDFCHGTLSPDELCLLRNRSTAAGAKVNDVLLAAAFKTVEQWNDLHGKPSRKITIMAPVDIARATLSQPRGNRVSFISVSTSPQERANLSDLLRTVNQKTSRMLRNGTAFSIVYAVHVCCRLPHPIPKAVARFLLATRTYLDSILVTNLGVVSPGAYSTSRIEKIGDAVITNTVVIPPVVSPMGISISANTYNDRLYVAMAYKTRQFSREEARLLLDLYLLELRSYQRTAEGLLAPPVRERQPRETVPAK